MHLSLSSGPITSRPCTCSSRSPTSCALRAASVTRGTWTDVLGNRQRAVLGADHPYALMTANGLGADLRARSVTSSRPSPWIRETDLRFKEQFGEDYPRTLAAAHNLAASLRLVGDCFKARGYYEAPWTGNDMRRARTIQTPCCRRRAWPLTYGQQVRSGIRGFFRAVPGRNTGRYRRRHAEHTAPPQASNVSLAQLSSYLKGMTLAQYTDERYKCRTVATHRTRCPARSTSPARFCGRR